MDLIEQLRRLVDAGSLSAGRPDAGSEAAAVRHMPGVASARRGVDRARRTVDGVASTVYLDRHGEIVLPSAFRARMKAFLESNAPMSAAHAHSSADGKPTQIGWVEDLRIERYRVVGRFRYAATAAGEEWWQLASDDAGKGHAFSIGFIPRAWVRGTVAELTRAIPDLREALKGSGYADSDPLTVYTEIELVEIAAVMSPSNRQSVQIRSADLAERLAERLGLRERSSEPPAGSPGAADIETLMEQVDELKLLLLDRTAELRELIELSGVELPGEREEPADAPASGEAPAAPSGAERGASDRSAWAGLIDKATG